MKLSNVVGAGVFGAGQLTNQDWIAIIGILIMILSMLQKYLEERSS